MFMKFKTIDHPEWTEQDCNIYVITFETPDGPVVLEMGEEAYQLLKRKIARIDRDVIEASKEWE